MRNARMRQGYASPVDEAGNYHSGDDYVVEFLGYRFSFSAFDFEQRVTAAAVKLGLLGGAVGLLIASFMQLVTISTMNWQTFAELAFGFVLTPAIAWQAMSFALAMGLAGGLLPALRAARLEIVGALRSD